MNDEYELLIYPEEAKNFSTDRVCMIQVREMSPVLVLIFNKEETGSLKEKRDY